MRVRAPDRKSPNNYIVQVLEGRPSRITVCHPEVPVCTPAVAPVFTATVAPVFDGWMREYTWVCVVWRGRRCSGSRERQYMLWIIIILWVQVSSSNSASCTSWTLHTINKRRAWCNYGFRGTATVISFPCRRGNWIWSAVAKIFRALLVPRRRRICCVCPLALHSWHETRTLLLVMTQVTLAATLLLTLPRHTTMGGNLEWRSNESAKKLYSTKQYLYLLAKMVLGKLAA